MTPLAQPIPLATAGLPMMVVWAIVIFGMFFLMRRPVKRQQEQQRQMQSTMQPGTRVMLSSGLFATITHIGDKQAIVELAPGVEVTVLRQVLSKVVQPDEEEFEFADSSNEQDLDSAADPDAQSASGQTDPTQPQAFTAAAHDGATAVAPARPTEEIIGDSGTASPRAADETADDERSR